MKVMRKNASDMLYMEFLDFLKHTFILATPFDPSGNKVNYLEKIYILL